MQIKGAYMKKKNLIILILFYNSINSQNLIKNPSFEDYWNLPTGYCQSHNIKYWVSAKENINPVTYFNVNNGKGYSPSKSEGGEQIAFDGNGFIGLGFGLDKKTEKKTQYIYIKLGKELIKNHKYKISAHVSLAEGSKYIVNNIRCAFMNNKEIVSDKIKLVNENNSFLNSSKNWTRIECFYTATGEENIFVLGDSDYEKVLKNKFEFNILHLLNVKACYYFIDNVSIVDITDKPEDAVNNHNSKDDTLIKTTNQLYSSLNVFFANNSHSLNKTDLIKLDSLISEISSSLKTNIQIYGYSSKIGAYEKNINLSIQRAKVVFEYLLSKTKNLNLNITYEGKGYYTNEIEQNDAFCRKVSIKINSTLETKIR